MHYIDFGKRRYWMTPTQKNVFARMKEEGFSETKQIAAAEASCVKVTSTDVEVFDPTPAPQVVHVAAASAGIVGTGLSAETQASAAAKAVEELAGAENAAADLEVKGEEE